MTFATITSRYRHWVSQVQQGGHLFYAWNGIHSFRIAGNVWLTFRPRQLRYTTVGLSVYALSNVVDVTLHLVVFSIGIKIGGRR